MKMGINTATVSQITAYIKSGFDQDELLRNIWIKGEISNFKLHYSGHMYLTLKDEGAVLRAVMFRSSGARLKFRPDNGMKILARGRISVYERDGQYQLYIEEMILDGVGDLHVAYEQLLEKLRTEGLFDESRKKTIPRFPKRIGVITSSTGAAIKDILNVLKRRFKLSEVVIFPVLVQGEGASRQISEAIKYFNETDGADVLIVGRGGGSIEDLWAFNEELTVRSVAGSRIPVISAVGHETDFTLCDFAADLRAPTPSAAAELAVPSSDELYIQLNTAAAALSSNLLKTLSYQKERLHKMSSDPRLTRFFTRIDDKRIALDTKVALLDHAIKRILTGKGGGFKVLSAALDALSPLKVLGRGYSVALHKDGTAVRDAKELETGESLDIIFNRGRAECTVVSTCAERGVTHD